jgi:hypothetical protein
LWGEKVSENKIELAERALAVNLPVVMPLAIHVLLPGNGDLGDASNEQ